MAEQAGFMDELERDLGRTARLNVMAAAGGQRRFIPHPRNAAKSGRVAEFGLEVTLWLAGRFGGEYVTFPSRGAMERDEKATALTAAILDAGLTNPKRSADDIAQEFSVSRRWVEQQRSRLRMERDIRPDDLPLFSSASRTGSA